MTHSSLVARLRELISLTGHDSSLYSGHSLRRGGAEFCASTGLSNIVIQLRGDWKSLAYLRYVSLDDSMNLNAARVLALAAGQLSVV